MAVAIRRLADDHEAAGSDRGATAAPNARADDFRPHDVVGPFLGGTGWHDVPDGGRAGCHAELAYRLRH